MPHSGKALMAAVKLVLLSLGFLLLLILAGFVARVVGSAILDIAGILILIWALFAAFTFYFFRDPEANVPLGANLVVSPGHGKVDAVESFSELEFMGGPCQRISIFLSVIDIHVQNAPVGGHVRFFKYTTGQFLSALKSESAIHNENLLIGFESVETRGAKVGVRLIAGVLARRIVPFVNINDGVARGERISLIQFGSRADIYLPVSAKLKVKIGDRVVGGETVLAVLE
ncbi:MAG TPA: phosphatidylserine decarboxylase [Verrucomicrobiae bacterium]|nr:phosphatidylserine decarboxylase [Verrucomicrobiae bacterium]